MQVVSGLVEAAVVNLHLEHALDVEGSNVAEWLGVEAELSLNLRS